MKLPGTCSLSKESYEKKKKMGLLFWGSGTPTFWLGLLLFTKRESRTPTYKILVRTLIHCQYALESPCGGIPSVFMQKPHKMFSLRNKKNNYMASDKKIFQKNYFLLFHKTICCRYSLGASQQGAY